MNEVGWIAGMMQRQRHFVNGSDESRMINGIPNEREGYEQDKSLPCSKSSPLPALLVLVLRAAAFSLLDRSSASAL